MRGRHGTSRAKLGKHEACPILVLVSECFERRVQEQNVCKPQSWCVSKIGGPQMHGSFPIVLEYSKAHRDLH